VKRSDLILTAVLVCLLSYSNSRAADSTDLVQRRELIETIARTDASVNRFIGKVDSLHVSNSASIYRLVELLDSIDVSVAQLVHAGSWPVELKGKRVAEIITLLRQVDASLKTASQTPTGAVGVDFTPVVNALGRVIVKLEGIEQEMTRRDWLYPLTTKSYTLLATLGLGMLAVMISILAIIRGNDQVFFALKARPSKFVRGKNMIDEYLIFLVVTGVLFWILIVPVIFSPGVLDMPIGDQLCKAGVVALIGLFVGGCLRLSLTICRVVPMTRPGPPPGPLPSLLQPKSPPNASSSGLDSKGS